VILCADTFTPRYGKKGLTTHEGLEPTWGVNYLANFHLLSILSPALRAQPADRDVRIIFSTCASYLGGDLTSLQDTRAPLPPGREYATSKLATMVFARAFQSHLDAYARPDAQPNNARVMLVDPGFARTPGMRRWLTMGSLWGLGLYLMMWPFWWLVLKSPVQSAQSFLRAAMEAELGRGVGGRYVKECREGEVMRAEVGDEGVAKRLWEFSERQVEALEKEGAVKRAGAKKEEEKRRKGEHSGSSAGKEQERPAGRIEEMVEDEKTEETTPAAQKKKTGSRKSRKA